MTTFDTAMQEKQKQRLSACVERMISKNRSLFAIRRGVHWLVARAVKADKEESEKKDFKVWIIEVSGGFLEIVVHEPQDKGYREHTLMFFLPNEWLALERGPNEKKPPT